MATLRQSRAFAAPLGEFGQSAARRSELVGKGLFGKPR